MLKLEQYQNITLSESKQFKSGEQGETERGWHSFQNEVLIKRNTQIIHKEQN